MQVRVRRLLLAATAGVGLALGAAWLVGSQLIATRYYRLAPPAALQAQTVALTTRAGAAVEGWLVPGTGKGVVLLLHGIRGDRSYMTARAGFLNKEGYSVLMIDLPGHGASRSSAMTFGLRESDAVEAALQWLRRQYPQQRLGVIGFSLGAASFVLCEQCPHVDAAVLEAMYPTIEEAVDARLRMRLGALAEPLSRILLWQLPLRLDIQPEQLRPIERMPALSMPLLVIAGDLDQHTPIAQTRRIYAAASGHKELWEVHGAAHVDLHGYAPVEYEKRIKEFLDKSFTDERTARAHRSTPRCDEQ